MRGENRCKTMKSAVDINDTIDMVLILFIIRSAHARLSEFGARKTKALPGDLYLEHTMHRGAQQNGSYRPSSAKTASFLAAAPPVIVRGRHRNQLTQRRLLR